MIDRNISNKIIISTMFVHMILLIISISSSLFVENSVIPCLSSFENADVSVPNEKNVPKIKNEYEMPPISLYPEISSCPICDVNTENKIVSFSFDDGYDYDKILKILDIFKKNGNLKTTFFFCGHAIDSDEQYARKENRDSSVKVVHDNGHEIGNHSDSHPNFAKLNDKSSLDQIDSCNEKIKNITGKTPTIFRFPYGSYNSNSLNVVKNLKMFPVQWSIDTLDWSKKSSCESICNSIMNNLSNGAIILMHTNGKHTAESLEIVIPKILELGYKIVPVSDLITKKY